MQDLDSCLQIAKSASLLAGNFLKEQQSNNLKILSHKGRDLKLQVDIDAEKIIKESITQQSSLPILAEESGMSTEPDELFLGGGSLGWDFKFFKKYPNLMCFYILDEGVHTYAWSNI